MQVRLIDANSLGFAQHSSNPVTTRADGLQTQAIMGVMKHMAHCLRYDSKVLNILVWDGRAQWRYDLHPGYKINRHKTQEQRDHRAAYERARPILRKALEALPVIQLCSPNAEADDVAFGVSGQLSSAGHLVSLRTADTDWLQMVNARCRWENARKANAVVELDGFAKACGFASPAAVPAVKALSGDPADDISGLDDVGDKRAAYLLAKYGTFEGVIEASKDDFSFSQEPRYFHSLMLPENRERIERNYQLVCLAKGPVLTEQDIELTVGEFDDLALYENFVDLGLEQWTDNGFSYWTKFAEQPLSKADVLSVKRSLAVVSDTWNTKP